MKIIKNLTLGVHLAIGVGLLFLTLPSFSSAQTNPCAPRTKKSSPNPCAAKARKDK